MEDRRWKTNDGRSKMEDRRWRFIQPPSSIFHLPSFPPVTDLIDRAANIIRDVERTVRPLRESRGTMQAAVLAGTAGVREIDREILERPGLAALHWQEHHAKALLRLGRAIPRSVEGDERTVPVLRRELRTRVEHHVVRRPVTRKDVFGLLPRRAPGVLLAVATVFRRVHELLLLGREVAVGPAEVGALENMVHLLAGVFGVVILAEAPVTELVAAVHRRPERVIARIQRQRHGVAHPGREPRAVSRMLAGLVRVERPDARARFELHARIDTRRLPLSVEIGRLAGVRARTDVHVERAT